VRRSAAAYGAHGGADIVDAPRRGQLIDGAASHETPSLACLLEDPSWRHAGSVERLWRADACGAGRRRKRDQQEELGGCGRAAAGIVA
jgi:hypothetical protein